ncbi:PucR family transcriptional regulator [Rhodococcus gordoniae]
MSDDVQRIVDDLASRLNRSVIIDTPAIQVRAVSRHFGDEDDVRIQGILQRQAPNAAITHILDQGVQDWIRTGFIPADDTLHMKRRMCCPIRWQGELLGFMMIIDADATLTPDEVSTAELAANMAAGVMIRESQDNQRERLESEALLGQLLSADNDETRAALHRLTADHRMSDDAANLVEVELIAPTEHKDRYELILRETLETLVKHRAGETILFQTTATRATVVQIGHPTRLDTDDFLTALKTALEHALGPTAEPCRLGTARSADLTSLATIRDRASTALAATRRIPRTGDLVHWEDLGFYALILHIPDDTLRRTIPPAIPMLLAADPSKDLLRTAEVFLDAGGVASIAAAHLHVHRTTLYYRLSRITETTGLDLQDGLDRLTLHLAIKAAKVCGYL